MVIRRQFLKKTAIGLVAIPALLPAIGYRSESAPITEADLNCVLTPQQTTGPFYFDTRLSRSNITEGRPGIPLALTVKVVKASDCSPMAGVVVDIWHSDKDGMYSGYKRQGDDDADTSGETFCRGYQATDASGEASFITLFPGWYPGRVPHIHFKVYTDSEQFVTSQMYTSEVLNKQVYQTPMYAGRGQSPTTHRTDGVLRNSDPGKLTLELQKSGDGFKGIFIVGVA